MAIRTPSDYLRLLQSLLPKGTAWNRNEGSALTQFLYGQAEEFARVDNRSGELLNERDTRISSELLVDHETDLGLPDDCSPEGETIQERRLAAHARLIALGQQTPQYFIDVAAAAGWTISITEYTPFWCGIGVCGDPIGDQDNIFHWKITITVSEEIIYFLCGSSQCGDPLQLIKGTDSIICTLTKLKPAHTILTFDVDGPEFSIGYSSGFDSIPSEETGHLEGAYSKGFGLGFDVNYGGGFNKDAFGIGYKQPN